MEMRRYEKNKPYFRLIDKKYEPAVAQRQKKVWLNRDRIIRTTGIKSLQSENIFQQCAAEIERMDEPFTIDTDRIIANFLLEKERKLKK